jgi:hypothetical protein
MSEQDPHPSDAFPKAPTAAEWERMTAAERQRVVDTLPNEVTDAEMSPPEGDAHFLGKLGPYDALRTFFKKSGRAAYFACELPVYYPGARRFAPDLLGVLDVEDRERGKWLVSAEGKGLDFVLEVHVAGDRKKDAERNVRLYSSLGIPDYFIYDRERGQLTGHRLAEDRKSYRRVIPQAGHYRSEALGLDLRIIDGRLRFFIGGALLPEAAELIARLERLTAELEDKRDAEAQSARAESERAQAEAARADRAEQENAVLRAELAKLRTKKPEDD